MAFRSPWQWNWPQIPKMLPSIWDVYCERPVFYAAMTGITIAGIAAIKHPTTAFRRLLAETAICWIGYNVFLVLVYLGAMTDREAANAADYWRYMPHLGLLGTSAVAVGIVGVKMPDWISGTVRAAGLACLVAFPLTVVRYAENLSPISKSWPMQYRQIGRELADTLPIGARVIVTTWAGYDPMPVAIGYDLWRPGRDDRNLRAVWEDKQPNQIREMFRAGYATHLLLTAALINNGQLTEALGLRAMRNETTLFAWNGDGWLETRTWPVIPAPKPEPVPSDQPEQGPDAQVLTLTHIFLEQLKSSYSS